MFIYFNLDIGEGPTSADVIIVNEGGTPDRAKKAVKLLEADYADKIMVSPPSPTILEWYYEAGATEDDLIFETQASTTWTNAKYSLALMDELGYDSALVVSSDYHMRRVRLVYERVNRDYDFDLTYISAYPIVAGEEIPYYQHERNCRGALNELWKYPGYLLGLYHFANE